MTKGTFTEEELAERMRLANEEAEYNRCHRWWVQQTSPQRKWMLAREIKQGLGEDHGI